MLCQACLAAAARLEKTGRHSAISIMLFAGGSLVGAFVTWFIFFIMGDLLAAMPDSWFDIKEKTGAIVKKQ